MKKKVFGTAVLLWILSISALRAEIYYPWKDAYIGALQAEAWAGLAIAADRDCLFAFRIRVRRENQNADWLDLLYLVAEAGPHSPDGRYARVSFDLSLPFGKENETPILKKPAPRSETMVLEWSRQDEFTAIGKITLPKDVEIDLIHYYPWNFRGRYLYKADGQVKGESVSREPCFYLFWTDIGNLGRSDARGALPEVTVTYPAEKARSQVFVVGAGKDDGILANHIYRYKNKRTIEKILKDEEQRYQKNRVRIDGLFEGVEKAITQNIFWMTLYQPGNHRLYSPAGRRWIYPRGEEGSDFWTIFEWDSFFNALELGVESFRHASDVVRSVLETQYPNGNIPNWRGGFGGTPDRSQPPIGSYVVLKLFQKFGDLEGLRSAYPYLRKWHSFWRARDKTGRARRDGNGDGLLEWGSDRALVSQNVPTWEKDATGKQRAMWESGQEDLPNWEEAGFNGQTGTMTMNCLDLNCLFALDAWCLSQIAGVLKHPRQKDTYFEEYQALKSLINEQLWNEQEGFYFDRHWDGRFSERKAASNFYPLIARIPDKPRAMRMLRHLLSEDEFWGEYVLPTISRDDPAFNDQQYWRGTIWPPTNYLIYQGLKAYHFDPAASEFARKSAELFMRTWEHFQLCPENYDSRTGEAGGQRYQSWGPLFALIALEEYIDFTPWEGFRFGMIEPEKKGRLERVFIQGRHYDIQISSGGIRLWEEGREIIRTNGGAVIRHFLYSESEISFEIHSLEEREVNVRFLAKGKYQLQIDDGLMAVFKGRSYKVRVPAQEHTVTILLLEKDQ